MKHAILVISIVLAALTGACTGDPTTPSESPAFAKVDIVVGTGAEAITAHLLTVDYTGWLYDPSKTDFKGLQFDTGTGFQFVLGNGQVIQGWDQGLPGLKVGGVRRLIVPASLAYGATRSSKIPPNAALVFDVKLTDVQ